MRTAATPRSLQLFTLREEKLHLHNVLPLSLCPGAKTTETPAGKTRLMHMHSFFVLPFMQCLMPNRLNTDSSPEYIVAVLCCVLDHMATKTQHPKVKSSPSNWLCYPMLARGLEVSNVKPMLLNKSQSKSYQPCLPKQIYYLTPEIWHSSHNKVTSLLIPLKMALV